MKFPNTYIAYVDTGRNYLEFEFMSYSRANSKKNKEDAIKWYNLQHGYHKNLKVIKTYIAK